MLGRLAGRGFVLAHRYRNVAALAGTVTSAAIEALRADAEVRSVDVDPVGTAADATSLAQIHGDVVHSMYGLTGAGVTVAVLDSGLDRSSPDLADAIVDEQCFCSFGTACCPNGQPTQSGAGAAEDDDGHGSHVTGILLGNGIVGPIGVAPDASLVAIKVLNATNTGQISDWTAGLDWLIDHHPEVRAVNMSLCWPVYSTGTCDTAGAAVIAMASAIDTLTAAGTSVFVASCNGGLVDSISVPACITNAVAVGAVDSGDVVASFTNSSEALDVLAPGVDILSNWLNGATAYASGTSMATPHAVGVAALLDQARPGLSSTGLLQALAGGGVPITDERQGRVRPRIDAEGAYLKLANCGDGAVGPLEQCDDGNTADGDGCSSACDLECTAAPLAGCRHPVASGKALFALKDRSPDSGDKLLWKWSKGETTTLADYGDPRATDAYRLCVYDANGLRGGAAAPAGGTCGGAPCWSLRGAGYAYKDRAGVSTGLVQVILKEGTTPGRASIVVKGKGVSLALPPPATLASPVTVQLRRAGGPCWEAIYGAPFLTQDYVTFKDKAD